MHKSWTSCSWCQRAFCHKALDIQTSYGSDNSNLFIVPYHFLWNVKVHNNDELPTLGVTSREYGCCVIKVHWLFFLSYTLFMQFHYILFEYMDFICCWTGHNFDFWWYDVVLLQTNLLELTGNMVDVFCKCLAMCLSVALVCVMQTCFDFVINKCAKVLC